MRLGINGWRLCGPRTGVARYLLNVVRYWTADASPVFRDITIYTPRPLDRRYAPLPGNIRERVLGPDLPMLIWENLRLAPACHDDVLFCPSYSRPLLARGRTVVATHDVIYHVRPDLFPRSVRLFYRRLYDWSDRHATAITTLGETVKREIVQFCGVPAERVHAIYPAPAATFGPSSDRAAIDRTRRRYGVDAPFFLFVGKMTGRRSVRCLVEAFALVKQQRSLPHKLVLVGPASPELQLPALARALGIGEDVILTGFIDDDDLNLLYNAAESLVMPSVYETTSLPIMEAQASGLPVICSGTPGLTEITGDTAIRVDMMEPGPLAAAMGRLATDRALRDDLSRRGLHNAARFSWQRCSAETMRVIEAAGRA